MAYKKQGQAPTLNSVLGSQDFGNYFSRTINNNHQLVNNQHSLSSGQSFGTQSVATISVGKGSFQTDKNFINNIRGSGLTSSGEGQNQNTKTQNQQNNGGNRPISALAQNFKIQINSLKKQGTITASNKNLTHTLKTQQTKKNRKKIQAEDFIKVDNLENGNSESVNKAGQNIRGNEQGQIQDLHFETYQKQVKVNAEQFISTIGTAIDHFSANYGETLTMKTAVEYAPKYDYNLLEKENNELHKQYDPIKKELKKAKKNHREVQLKYDKLMANVNYTKSLKKRYEIKLEEQRDQLKDVQFYYNDLKEKIERETISRENHLMIFKRIINKIETEKMKYSSQNMRQLETQMEEFLKIAEGKMIPKNMQDYLFKNANISPSKTKKNSSLSNTLDQSLQARDNPPTTTGRGNQNQGSKGNEPLKSERTVDVAVDYIKRLERELKSKNNEHHFLKSRLEKAFEKKSHPSVASWQNSEAEINSHHREDDFEKGDFKQNTNDRQKHYNQTQPFDKNVLNLKLPIQFVKTVEQQNNFGMTQNLKQGQHINKDLVNMRSSSQANLRPKTAVPNKKEFTQKHFLSSGLQSTQQSGTASKFTSQINSPDTQKKSLFFSSNNPLSSVGFNSQAPQQNFGMKSPIVPPLKSLQNQQFQLASFSKPNQPATQMIKSQSHAILPKNQEGNKISNIKQFRPQSALKTANLAALKQSNIKSQ
eukprot:403372904